MKTTRFILFVGMAMLLALAACSGPAPAPPPEPEPPAPQPAPPEPEPAPPEPEPAPPEPEPEPEPEYAPFCEAAAGCAAPEVTEITRDYCIEKAPYTILAADPGTTYESQDEELQCVDQMHSDGRMRITCHSVKKRQLWTFPVKMCNSECAAPSLQMGSAQCPDGYGFDAASQCCAMPPAGGDDAGCFVYDVNLGACPGG